MRNPPAVTDPKASAIRCSSDTLTALIPTWVDPGALDAIVPHGYGLPIPVGAAPALRDAAAAHRAALTPSTSEQRHALLMGMRSCTLIRDEDGREAEASLKMLRVHLDDVPLDILEAACRAYVNAPGRRYFPRAAGELRTFINPLLYARQARATRLARLADEAERQDARAAELAADPLTPEAAREILAQARLSVAAAARVAPGMTGA